MTFVLAEAVPSDLEEINNVHFKSMENDFLFTKLFPHATTEEQYKVQSDRHSERLQSPHHRTFKITDIDIG